MVSDDRGPDGVSRETLEKLESYAGAVGAWTRAINLIAESTVENIWDRHVLDAAQLLKFAPPEPKIWCDLGSGAGLPGLVIAILNLQTNPNCRHVLIESDRRKAAFLTMQAKTLAVRAQVVASRIETAPSVRADVITARALAPLPRLLSLAQGHATETTTFIFPKGRAALAEVAAARGDFDFNATMHPSETDPEGLILVINALTPRKKRA